jgi:hypothetical protein
MKKEHFIIGLPIVIIGGILLLSWYSKPKKNSDNFYNATGGCGCGAK